MPRTFLIDAHNALFALWPQPPTSGEGVLKAVVARAKASLPRHGAGKASGGPDVTAHLVFDTGEAGRQRAGTHGRDGAVSWSYATGSADEEIVRLVREHEGSHAGAPIVVVTDDRELRGRASQLGAKVLRVHEWFSGESASEERRAERAGPPLTAADFGFTQESFDLRTDPDDVD